MIFLYAWIFYIGFAAGISVYRTWVKGDLNLLNKLLFAPLIIGFGIVDVVLNYTLLVPYFGWPKGRDYTISTRFETLRNIPAECPQRTFAVWFCDKLLNPIDPSGRHC
jgi:hypothetical protein